MTGEFERAFCQTLKSVILEVADEILCRRTSEASRPSPQPANEADPLLIRPNQVAKRLGISPRTLFKLTVEGDLPCVRVSRLVRYRVEAIEHWIRERESTEVITPKPRRPKSDAATLSDQQPTIRKSNTVRRVIPDRASPSKPVTRAAPTSRSSSTPKPKPPIRRPAEEWVSPFRLLLAEMGIDSSDVGPISNGDLMRIAGVDTATMHGWLYLGRELPETAMDNLRQHFARLKSSAD